MLLGLLIGLTFVTPLVFFYVLVIKGVDRYEPEPWWLLTAAFLWGAFASTALAIVGNGLGDAVFTAALGQGNPLIEGATASIVAPLVEESTKGLGLLLLLAVSLLWLHEVDGPLDGVIYGGVVGLGFTFTEDILYISRHTAEHGVAGGFVLLVLRTVLAGLGHASFTAMTGLGIGIAVVARNPLLRIAAPIAGWCLAVLLHGIHNGLVSFFGGAGLVVKLLFFWLVDILFFVLLFALALRDRRLVREQLAPEVGVILHELELENVTRFKMLLPLWNTIALWGDGLAGYRQRRAKQLALIELAFAKDRAQRDPEDAEKAAREAELRRQIDGHNAAGVFVGT
ncbi:MAG: PrsW family intramembrane metalloprotease [Vicinamibacteria bacterium]|nr:PrsW family intramembrane metalloprotease [Vicinamibacteria bacterium]